MAEDNMFEKCMGIKWSSEEMIAKADEWSLSGDIALFNKLNAISEIVLEQSNSLQTKVTNMMNNLEHVNLKLQVTKNEFHSLRNTQFIENRVYEYQEMDESESKKDEDELLKKNENQADIAIKGAISKGLELMNKYYEKIEYDLHDNDSDNEESYYVQQRDAYRNRKLPFMVGSDSWSKKWHVGLLSDSNSTSSDEKEKEHVSSDDEDLLPKNDILGSETSSEAPISGRLSSNSSDTNMPANKSSSSDSNGTRHKMVAAEIPKRQRHYSSSSESSAETPIKTSLADRKLAKEVSDAFVEGMRAKAKLEKVNKVAENKGIFSDEPPPLDDPDNRVKLQSSDQGMFSSGRDLFSENVTDDIFSSKSQDKPSSTKPPPVFKDSLFGDSSSEEDMVAAIEKRRFQSTSARNPYLPPKSALPFVDDRPPEIAPQTEVAKKKPVGGISIFGEHQVHSELSNQHQKVETPKPVQKKAITSLFDDTSEEEMFVPKSHKEETIKTDLFEESLANNPSLFESKSLPKESRKKFSLFDDDDDLFKEEEDIFSGKSKNIIKTTLKKESSLFDALDDSLDNRNKSESFSIENSIKIEEKAKDGVTKSNIEDKVKPKTISLFSSDTEPSEDEIFGNKVNDEIFLSNEDSEIAAKEEIDKITPAQLVEENPQISPNSEIDNRFQESPDKEDSTQAAPPSINLFDPTPPPVDWDVSSNASAESDNLSFGDSMLDESSYIQPPASSIFDEAPPSLDNSREGLKSVDFPPIATLPESDHQQNVDDVKVRSSDPLEIDTNGSGMDNKLGGLENSKDDNEEVKPPTPGKLKHSLNINVGALMPGARRPQLRSQISVDETDRLVTLSTSAPRVVMVARTRPKSEIFLDTNDDEFGVKGHEVLESVTRDRVKIPVKRRPSSRRARIESVRKSASNFSFFMSPSIDDLTRVEESITDDINDSNEVVEPTENQSNDTNLFANNNLEKDQSEITEDPVETANDSPVVSNSPEEIIINQLSNSTSELNKSTIFDYDDDGSDSDNDLFATSKPTVTKVVPTIFCDKSDESDSEDMFGNKSSLVKKKTDLPKKVSLFGDSDDSDDDLFGSTKRKDFKQATESSETVGKRAEIKVASVRKLENTDVTDNDPLSDFK